jgi:ATPase subunit of ABC transporter with duplicated ATPase domains
MITVSGVSLVFQDKKLFEDVNLKFTPGNCYGVIGANGAGKTTFTRILSGDLEPTSGEVSVTPGERLAVLEQDHFRYDDCRVLDTVMMGFRRLYEIMKEKEALYAKPDFTAEDGERAAALEGEFAELNGWDAESDAEKLLTGLGVGVELHGRMMRELDGGQKVKVLLAQALFGSPQILLLDEPTNHLDLRAIRWLEDFLLEYPNTVIVVSHDRHFLNKVCTHMVDIDYGKISMVVGNYDFWYESSQLAQRLLAEQNRKKEEKIKDLQAFIERFSSNASKAKQATARKKLLDKITLDDIRPSSRRYPFVGFNPDREAGKDILTVEHLSKTVDGVCVLNDVSFIVDKGDRVVLTSRNEQAKTLLLQILAGEVEPDEGVCKWGVTISRAYLPKDNSAYFEGSDLNLIDWLRQYADDQHESTMRGFLGKMLFSGDDPLKNVAVLSGGEKMRCMLSKMMLSGANVLLLDDPTNHLDLESITAVNKGLMSFPGTMIFSSRDHEFIQTLATRVIELTPGGVYDNRVTFDEFLEDDAVQARLDGLYAG